jgi:ATP-binding cassette subfamily E protein 1
MTVEEYLTHKISQALYHNVEFIQEVLSPLKINDIKNNNVNKLSGGELQRVCLAECLGNISAFLDVEQRILISKMLRKYMYMHKKTAFIVEHDIMMCSYLADKMIVFQQNSSYDELAKNTSHVTTVTNSLSAEKGMYLFLRQMDVSINLAQIKIKL